MTRLALGVLGCPALWAQPPHANRPISLQSGQTPLMIAAQGNHAAICSQLLQRGAKVDLADKDGK